MTAPPDGRLTSQTVFAGPLTGGEVMYIVSPGNAALGQSYQVTALTLAQFFSAFPSLNATIITSGATYNSVATDTRILVDKTIGSATTINLLAATSYVQPVLVKDVKGDAAANPITITFPGTYDGVASPLTINTNYGWVWFNPLPTGNFYET